MTATMGEPEPDQARSVASLARHVLVDAGYRYLSPERVASTGGLSARTVRRAFANRPALAVAAVTGSLRPPAPPSPDVPPGAALERWHLDVVERVAFTVQPLAALVEGDAVDADTLDEVHRRTIGPSRLVLDTIAAGLDDDERDVLCTAAWSAAVMRTARFHCISWPDACRLVRFIHRPTTNDHTASTV